MPGRNPYQAVQNYLDPIRECLGVLGHPTLILGRDLKYELGAEGYWRLGAEDGLQLRVGGGSTGYLEAEQAFRIVETDPERRSGAAERFRVTTTMYAYQLRIDGIVEWQMHWHPQGKSPENRPHYHLHSRPGAHLPSARHTIEDAIEWCVGAGAETTTSRWEEILLESKKVHQQHRSWDDQPVKNNS